MLTIKTGIFGNWVMNPFQSSTLMLPTDLWWKKEYGWLTAKRSWNRFFQESSMHISEKNFRGRMFIFPKSKYSFFRFWTQ